MTETFLLQEKKIKEQENVCSDKYGEAAFNNTTSPIINKTLGKYQETYL